MYFLCGRSPQISTWQVCGRTAGALVTTDSIGFMWGVALNRAPPHPKRVPSLNKEASPDSKSRGFSSECLHF